MNTLEETNTCTTNFVQSLHVKGSTEQGDLALALSKAQAGFDSAAKDKKNPFFKSEYADLSSVIGASRKALTDNELAVIQFPSGDHQNVTVTTRLIHKSSQWLESSVSCKPAKPDPQGIGSVITYLRRYSLAAFLGITQKDDDGNSASVISPEQVEIIENLINGHEDIRSRMLATYGSIKMIPLDQYEKTIKTINILITDKE